MLIHNFFPYNFRIKSMGKKVKSLLKRTEKNETTERNVLRSPSRILSESSSNDEQNSDCSDTPLIGV